MNHSKKVLLVFVPLIVVLIALLCVCLSLLLKRPAPLILVSDDLYKSEWGAFFATDEVSLPFSFVCESEYRLPNARRKDAVVARLSLCTKSPLFLEDAAKAESVGHLFFLLRSHDMLPAIPADFKNKSNAANSVLSPTLSMNFCEEDSIPQGFRAIPINGKYAGEADYPLRVYEYVECVLFCDADSSIFTQIKSWLFLHFSKNAEQSALNQRPVFLASVGDIMVARGAENVLISQSNGLERVFTDTLPLLQQSDFTIGNLEGVVTNSWNNAIKTYTFKFDKRVLPRLKEAGFDYLMQTNNHCYDYGEAGFKDTLKAFAEYDIPSSGIGYTEDEAKQFYRTNVNGLSLSVISCGAFPVERSGFNGKTTATATKTRAGILWQSDELLYDIKREKEAGFFVVVNVHGGEEYVFLPTKSQRKLYESFCDFGADIVFGSHPHVIQPTEWYKGSLIVYSQGNFIFNGMEDMPGATDSEVVRVGVLNGHIAYVEQYPAQLNGYTVSLQ